MIEYGRVGRIKNDYCDFTFMVLGHRSEGYPPEVRRAKEIQDTLLIAGEVRFANRIFRFGEIGPVATDADYIEWLDDE